MGNKVECSFINSKEKVELDWQCIILMKALNNLPIVALNLLFKDNIHFILQQKIRFLKNTMENSKTFFKKYMINNIRNSLSKKRSGINID
jgi:hypothetical protein